MLRKDKTITDKEMYDAIWTHDLGKIENLYKLSNIDRYFNHEYPDSNPRHKTFIHLAAAYSSPDIIIYMLKNGADINICDEDGNTPIFDAIEHNSVNALNTLLEFGADPNAKDKNRYTPLLCAVNGCSFNVDYVKKLLEAGANANERDRTGRSPYQRAVSMRDANKGYKQLISDHYNDLAELIAKYDITQIFQKVSELTENNHNLENKVVLMQNQINSLVEQLNQMQSRVNNTEANPNKEILDSPQRKKMKIIAKLKFNGRNIMDVRKKTEKVSDTAKPVLAVKYVTSKPTFWKNKGCGNRETPLSNNECSKIFLSDEDIEQAEKHPNIDNIKTVSVRERWINKLFEKYVKKDGYKQIVILGSGFDIRPYKKSKQNQENKKSGSLYSKLKFWEVDKPEILDEKEKIFQSKSLDKNATYIKADYTKTDFIKMLLDSGLNPKEPTLIIFEGNLMYLEKDQAKEVFSNLKASLNEFVITFDYFPQTLVNMIASNAIKGSNESLWKTGIDDLQNFALQCGLTVIDNRSIGELSKEYDVDNNPSYGANKYSVCALRK